MGDNEDTVSLHGKLTGNKLRLHGQSGAFTITPPRPDAPDPDLTGGWDDWIEGATLRINHAGSCILVWACHPTTKQVTEYTGVRAGTSFNLSAQGEEETCGVLHVLERDKVQLVLGGVQTQYSRMDHQPAVSDQTLLAFPPELRSQVRQKQRQATSRERLRQTVRALRASVIAPLIDEFYSLSAGAQTADKFLRAMVIDKIDKLVRAAFEGLPSDADRTQAKPWVLREWSVEKHLANGVEQSILAHLVKIFPNVRMLSDGGAALKKHLGFKDENRMHYYSMAINCAELKAKDLLKLPMSLRGVSFKVGLGGAAFGGTLEVKETTLPDGEGDVLQKFTLGVVLAGIGVGAGVSLGFRSTGTAATVFPWTENDFKGAVHMVDLSGGIANAAWGVTGVFFSGSGSYPELAADFTGRGVVVGIAAGITEYFGTIASPTQAHTYSIPDKTISQAAVVTAKSQVHFLFGNAELTDVGRDRVYHFAAQERAVLTSAMSQLLVEAHADRPATEAFNDRLTRARATNTLQALKDALGTAYAVEREHALGLGELEAMKAGDKPTQKNQTHRRADVTLNGRLSIQVQGE